MRLLAIGVDGCSFRVISPWLEAGALPHLSSLIGRGTRGALTSTLPPLTPPAWYASLTGVNPGRQNIFGFFRPPRERYAKMPVCGGDLKAAGLWDWLGRAGKESLILFLPLSYPPRAIRGAWVSGFMTPDGARDFASPSRIREEILEAVPHFRLNLDHSAIRLGQMDRFYREAVSVLEGQVRAAVHLMDVRPWDFCFVHLHDVDSITHQFWKHQDPAHPGYQPGNPHRTKLIDYYRAVDEAVGILVAAAGADTAVLLYSDHGFMPAYRYFSVNGWLLQEGYLRLKSRGGLGLKTALASAGFARERLQWWASRLGLSGLTRRLPQALKGAVPQTRFSFNDLAAHVDWPRTSAFLLSASEGSLYANIRGREPEGALEGAEAGRVLTAIRDGLLAFRDQKTGAPVLEGAWLKAELYSGPHADRAPDLVLLPADGWCFSENALGPMSGEQGMEHHQISATHHPAGVLVAAGGPFARAAPEVAARVWDVAPTVLRALDIPVPAGLDGRALEEVFDPRFLAEHPPRFEEAGAGEGAAGGGEIPVEEMQRIIGNLEGLGYY